MNATAAQIAALKSAIKLVADIALDTNKAASDSTSAAKMSEYMNVLPDLMALMPQIGNLSVSNLSVSDYATLLTTLATDLALPAGHTANVINASLKLLEDVATVIVPDVQALIAAINAPAAVVVPPVVAATATPVSA